MNKSGRALIAALTVVFALTSAAYAQLPDPPATTEDALRQMFDQAGVIFTGQVTAVRRIDPINGATGILEVDFAIDDAILGTTPNSTYTLREWAGLSPNSDTPFLIGKRYLVFLHTPGPSGLSSPVGGPDGAIPILPGNDAASPTTPDAAGLAAQAALIHPTQSAPTPRSPARSNLRLPATPADNPSALAFTNALASSTVDLRWIATRVLSPLAYADQPSVPAPSPARPILARAGAVLAESPSGAGPASANYSDLLTLLRSWKAQSNAAR